MSDRQGKGPIQNEGGVEKNTSRPAENDNAVNKIRDESRNKASDAVNDRQPPKK